MEFPKYLNKYRILPKSLKTELTSYLSKNFGRSRGLKNLPYSAAKVYTKSEAKESLKSIRKCLKFTSDDPWVFSFIEKNILSKIEIPGIRLQLIRDHWDVLYYKNGDYFERHQDFNKYSSDNIRTYSCLYSFTTVKRGGRTFLWLDKNKVVGLSGSNTENALSIFQNNLFHSGEKVLNGEKIVLKFDLHGFVLDESIKEDSIMKLITSDDILFYIPNSIIEKYNLNYFTAIKNFHKSESSDTYQLKMSSNEFSILYEFLMGSNQLSKERTEFLKEQLEYMCVVPLCKDVDAKHVRDIMDNKLLITSDPDVALSFSRNFMNNPNYFPFLIIAEHSKKFGYYDSESIVLENFVISLPNGLPIMKYGHSNLFQMHYTDESELFESSFRQDSEYGYNIERYRFLKNLSDDISISSYIVDNYKFYSENPIRFMNNLISNYITKTMVERNNGKRIWH